MNLKPHLSLIIVGSIIIIGIAIGTKILTKDKQIGVINPAFIAPALVDSSLQHITADFYIGNFQLQNQYGEWMDSTATDGKVYVVDFFFTTCQTICPVMTDQMERVQEAFKTEDNFVILSHSVTPDIDTVEQMARYAEAHGAMPNKWYFLTGPKEEVYRMARKNYFLIKKDEVGEAPIAGDGSQYDFIHTNNFVLIDDRNRIRGYYDGTSKEEVDVLIEDIQVLLKEKNERTK